MPIPPVVHEYPAGLAGLSDRGHHLAAVRHVEKHRGAGDVIAPSVVRHLLVVRDQLAGPDVEGDERGGVQVVAGA